MAAEGGTGETDENHLRPNKIEVTKKKVVVAGYEAIEITTTVVNGIDLHRTTATNHAVGDPIIIKSRPNFLTNF